MNFVGFRVGGGAVVAVGMLVVDLVCCGVDLLREGRWRLAGGLGFGRNFFVGSAGMDRRWWG